MTMKSTKPTPELARAERAIAKLAAAYPQVTEDRPWGHRAFKIRGKTFLFLGSDADGLGLSVKLPESGVMALELPFTEPTHYGLGKSGWVSASFKSGKDVPLPLVKEWLDESFRAIAPRKLGALLAAAAPPAKKPVRAAANKPVRAAANKPVRAAANKAVRAAANKPVRAAANKALRAAAKKPVRVAAKKSGG